MASPARFERAAFRLGVRFSAMINKPRRRLKKSKKPSKLGLFWLCSLRTIRSFRETRRGSLLSKCSQKNSHVCSRFKAVRNRYRTDLNHDAAKAKVVAQSKPSAPEEQSARFRSTEPGSVLHISHQLRLFQNRNAYECLRFAPFSIQSPVWFLMNS